jgi:hypothetical protein
VTDKVLRQGFYLPEVLIEIRRVGKSLRVNAIDPITRTEVIMVAPANATKALIKKNAARKLAYVIAKKTRSKKL